MAYVYRPPNCTVWHARVYLSPGRTICRSLKTRNWKVARLKATEIELEVKRTPRQPLLDATFAQVAEQFLTITQARVKPITQESYCSLVRNLLPYLNGSPLRMLTTGVLETQMAKMKAERQLTSTSYYQYLRFLKAAIGWMAREGYLPTNVAAELKVKAAKPRDDTWLPKERWQEVFALSKTTLYYPIILAGFYLGLRISSLLQLDWRDFNWKASQVQIRGRTTKDGKTLWLPLHQELIKVLKPFAKSDGLCFPHLNTRKVEHHVHQVLVAMKVYRKGMGTHVMRHSFAMRAIELYPLNVVQWLLGHSALQSTARYIRPKPATVQQINLL